MSLYSVCYIAFAGSAWSKGASAEDAARGVITDTVYEDVGRISIWRLTFPEPVDDLDCVAVDETGSVSYPTGTEVAKFERMPIPPAVTSAARQFAEAMQDWQDALDEQFESATPAAA